MGDARKNLAISTVATAPVTPTAGTNLVVASGEGSRFPATPFNATAFPLGGPPTPLTAEIVRVTNISGDTLTITRAQEGTTAMPIAVGWYIANTITKKALDDIETEYANADSAHVAAVDPHPQYTTAAEVTAYAQPLDPTLTALAGQNWAADAIPVGTGSDTVTQLSIPANRIPGRSSAGGVSPKTVSDAGFAFLAAADTAAETALLNTATPSLKGLMPPSDKVKLNGLHYDIVADGGADPTGVVDATTIINNAITAVGAAGGGVVYVPAGTFRINSLANPVTLSSNYVTLSGTGPVSSQLISDHPTANSITITGNNCRVEDLRIIAASPTQKTSGTGIYILSGATGNSIWNCDLIFMWSGIRMSGQLARVDFCNIRETGRNAINGYGILIDTFTDQYITNVVMDNGNGVGGVANSAGHAGIRITNLSSAILQNLQIIHCTNNLDVVAGTGVTIPSIKATGCFFDNGTYGMSMVQTSTGVITRCVFTNCWFGSNSAAGVLLNGANIDGIEMGSCEYYGNPFGIDAVLANDWAVRGSRFAGNTTNAIRTTAAAAHGFSITGNYIGIQAGFGANAQGVNIQAGSYERYQIEGNRGFDTNTTPGMIDLGTTTHPWQKRIDNNVGMLNVGAPTTLPTATTTPAANTATLIPGTVLAVPVRGLRIGSKIQFTVSVSKTTAGTAGAATFVIRWGATGTAADGAVLTFTIPGTTAVADTFNGVFIAEVTALGSGTSATVKGQAQGSNASANVTGYGSIVPAQALGTAAGFNSELNTTPFFSMSYAQAGTTSSIWGTVEVVA